MNDGPPLMPGEVDVAVNTVELWNVGAMDGTFVSTAGSAAGSVEPIARVAGKLFLEIDEENGPYDGTWASHPLPNQLVRTSLLAPPFAEGARGGPATFVNWMSGEIKLDAGAQKIAIPTSPAAAAFVDVMQADGKAVLVHCLNTAIVDCQFSAPAAGWYPVRIGWKRPLGTGGSLLLRGALGSGALIDIDAATRLRAPLVTAQHTGSRLEGSSIPRGFVPIETAVMIDADKPVDVSWGATTFGLGDNASYRNFAQLRITEDGTYDFVVDADGGASYRLWLDGEWISAAAAFNYIPDGTDPPKETITRSLKAGWHDLLLEGYDTRGDEGSVTLAYAKTGTDAAVLKLSSTRPAIGAAPLMISKLDDTPIQLASNAPVSRTLTVDPLATVAPDALGVDVSVILKPRVWNGLQIMVYPPGVATGIPLTFDRTNLPDNQSGIVTGSLAKAALGAATKAQGAWKIDVIHPTNAQLDATNVVSDVEVHVHYAGGAGATAATPFVSPMSTYSRMFKLAGEYELRNLYAEAIKPAGSDLKIELQVCADETGSSCSAAMSIEQLIQSKPVVRFAKVSATFISDGFAVPILGKLTLRYHDPNKVE